MGFLTIRRSCPRHVWQRVIDFVYLTRQEKYKENCQEILKDRHRVIKKGYEHYELWWIIIDDESMYHRDVHLATGPVLFLIIDLIYERMSVTRADPDSLLIISPLRVIFIRINNIFFWDWTSYFLDLKPVSRRIKETLIIDSLSVDWLSWLLCLLNDWSIIVDCYDLSRIESMILQRISIQS